MGCTPRAPRRLGRFDHDANRAHAKDDPVTAVVEGDGGLLDGLVGGRAPVAEARPHPLEQESEVTSSAPTMTTRRQRPARIQSSARATACVVLAHAHVDLGVRAPGADDLGELGVAHRQDRNRKRRSNSNGSASIAASISPIRRSISALASPAAARTGSTSVANSYGGSDRRDGARCRRRTRRSRGRPRRRSRRCRRGERRAGPTARGA